MPTIINDENTFMVSLGDYVIAVDQHIKASDKVTELKIKLKNLRATVNELKRGKK